MAYFSNGTEGMDYESRYCDNCVHFVDKQGSYACPVWNLHMEFNYDQCKNGKTGKAIAKILGTLIPRRDDGFAGDCSMFVEKKPVTDAQATYLHELREGKAPCFGMPEE